MKYSEVKLFGGVPTLWIDGTPVNGIMHWHRYPNRIEAALFRRAGIHLFSFVGNIDCGDENPEWKDGTIGCSAMTPEWIDQTMNELVAGNPDILVMPRIRLLPTERWKKNHATELMHHYNMRTGTYLTGYYASLFSEEWKQLVRESLSRTIAYFEEHWGTHVVGYHTGSGHCAENVYRWDNLIGDYCHLHVNAFRRYLEKKYQDVTALNTAWRKSFSTFSEVNAPPPQSFLHQPADARSLFDPATERDIIDWMEFGSFAMAQDVVWQGKTVKDILRKLKRKKIFGLFYAYKNMPANSLAYYSIGHDAHEDVLNSSDIDFLCAPIAYSARQPGGKANVQLLPGSVMLHGKLYYAEDDTGSHLASRHHGYVPATAAEFMACSQHNFYDIWRSGGTLWWMDLHGKGWFREECLVEHFASLRRFADEHLEHRASIAEIAVFCSDKSMKYLRCAPIPLTGCLVEQQLNEIAAIGAPYDLFLIEDIPLLEQAGRLGQYKFCIMLDVFSVEAHVRNIIDCKVKKNNRFVLWMYAPGIVDGDGFASEPVISLTGINVVLFRNTRASMLTETQLGPYRISYGSNLNFTPRLGGDDPDAQPLGFYVEGTPFGQFGASLLRKEFSDWTSIWSGTPFVPSALLSKIADEAGVHIYAAGHQVAAAESFLAIHAVFSGKTEIRFRNGETRMVELVRGENQCVVFPLDASNNNPVPHLPLHRHFPIKPL